MFCGRRNCSNVPLREEKKKNSFDLHKEGGRKFRSRKKKGGGGSGKKTLSWVSIERGSR